MKNMPETKPTKVYVVSYNFPDSGGFDYVFTKARADEEEKKTLESFKGIENLKVFRTEHDIPEGIDPYNEDAMVDWLEGLIDERESDANKVFEGTP
jgi:hypothetical protein